MTEKFWTTELYRSKVYDVGYEQFCRKAVECMTQGPRFLVALPVMVYGIELFGVFWVDRVSIDRTILIPVCSLNCQGMLQSRMRRELAKTKAHTEGVWP